MEDKGYQRNWRGESDIEEKVIELIIKALQIGLLKRY